ncbi:MAG: CRISPR-associated endonuclease Cas2 [Patescibacteria group bacterium]
MNIMEDRERRFHSPTKQKVLLLLYAGVALGLTPSINSQRWILKQLNKEWKQINRDYLYRIIREFKYDRLISWKEKEDGSVEVILTEKGKKCAFNFNFDKMEIKEPKVWDGKWRIVLYDIPEKNKKVREALRGKLKNLGFYELQKSVFVYPFPCKKEIDFIAEFFELRNFIYFIKTPSFSNDEKLRLHFGLV